jgi:transcriptional regulator with XRE-family HTH domain
LNLKTALDEYALLLRRRARDRDLARQEAALGALREYLSDYAGREETQELLPADLTHFLVEYYPSQEEPDAEVAATLLEVSADFGEWLLERGERSLRPFVAKRERLAADLRRTLEAFQILREDLSSRELETPTLLDGEEDEQETPIGAIGTGLSRVADLHLIDYPSAEEERFRVLVAKPGALTLHSTARAVLGQAPAEPVRVPAGVAERLRPDDILHAEIAPGPEGWELLEVFGVRPGGYE